MPPLTYGTVLRFSLPRGVQLVLPVGALWHHFEATHLVTWQTPRRGCLSRFHCWVQPITPSSTLRCLLLRGLAERERCPRYCGPPCCRVVGRVIYGSELARRLP